MALPIISLFCGCGGFDLGFAMAGFEVVLALDNDSAAVTTYNHNREGQVARQCNLATFAPDELIGLIKRGEVPSPIGVIGGPPCQPFSNGNNTRQEEDLLRKQLPGRFASMLSVLNEEVGLDFFVFENVKGITFEKHSALFAGFKRLFEGAGFLLFEALLDAKWFGVAQSRPRVFVVGLSKSKFNVDSFNFPVPSGGPPKSVIDAIGGLPEPTFFTKGLKPGDIEFHPNHWTMQPRSPKFTNGFLKEGQNRGKSFKVLTWREPSCTVAYGNREIHIHPSGRRRLSIYESMLLQGFPSSYQLVGTLSDQVRMISDAVPPPLAEALALSVRTTVQISAIPENAELQTYFV